MTVAWTEVRPAGDVNCAWHSVDTSADGKYMIACAYSGRLYVSTNYGQTWTEKQPAGDVSKNWHIARVSKNGQYMAAAVWNGRFYLSGDYGANWTEIFPRGPDLLGGYNFAWGTIAISATGATMVTGIAGPGRFYRSTNYGVNWSEVYPYGSATSRYYRSSDMSDDGQFIVATDSYRVYTSEDGGDTWHSRWPVGESNYREWWCSTCSSDGAVVGVGSWADDQSVGSMTFISQDHGVTWTSSPLPETDKANYDMDCSGDAANWLVGTLYGTPADGLYYSVIGGTTWLATAPGSLTGGNWFCAVSQDGVYGLAGYNGGRLWRGVFPPASSSSSSSTSSSSSFSSSSDSSSSSFVPLSWPALSKGLEFNVQELPGAHDIAMPLGCGLAKIRPRYTRRPHRWRFTIRQMTLADRLLLERFYLVDCRRGKYAFEFLEQGMNQTWLVRWDPEEPPRFEHEDRNPGKYRMTGVLLEDTAGSYGSGHYGDQYYDT